MGTLRTYNTRRWRRQGYSTLFMDSFEKNGRQMRELVMIQNGWALRHTPKQGVPGHFEAAEDDTWVWKDEEPSKG
jgi:hypothetical protein